MLDVFLPVVGYVSLKCPIIIIHIELSLNVAFNYLLLTELSSIIISMMLIVFWYN